MPWLVSTYEKDLILKPLKIQDFRLENALSSTISQCLFQTYKKDNEKKMDLEYLHQKH